MKFHCVYQNHIHSLRYVRNEQLREQMANNKVFKCIPFCLTATENRYEGAWKDDMKNGEGKFYYLDKGQLYEGTWLNNVPKCGTMKDFAREQAPDATQYELPHVSTVPNIFTFNRIVFMVNGVLLHSVICSG